MSLKSLTNYWSSKSIKLSDAFEVLIQYSPTSQFETMVNCTGFTLPKLEYDEETYEYGNLAQVFVVPKYDSCKEVTLEFYETMKDKNFSVTTSKIFNYMGYKLNQKFDNWLSVNSANYTIDKYISTIDIKVLDNKLWRYIYKYHFDNLKIVNYSIYNLDYQSDTPCTISITFSFESYKKEIINEKVEYQESQNQQKQQERQESLLSPEEAKQQYNDEALNDNLEDIYLNGLTQLNDVPEPTEEELAQEDQLQKQAAYEQMMVARRNEMSRGRAPDTSPRVAAEESQWASVEAAEQERQDVLAQQERAELDAQNELMYQATQQAQRGASRGPQGQTSNPNIGGGTDSVEESQWAQAEADEAKRQASQNYVSNQSGGYEKPKNEKAKEIEAKLNNEKPQLASTSSDISHSKPNESSKQNKSQYTSSQIQEMAKNAANYDKQKGVQKGKTGQFYQAGANAMGLDENARKEFESAYKANFS